MDSRVELRKDGKQLLLLGVVQVRHESFDASNMVWHNLIEQIEAWVVRLMVSMRRPPGTYLQI